MSATIALFFCLLPEKLVVSFHRAMCSPAIAAMHRQEDHHRWIYVSQATPTDRRRAVYFLLKIFTDRNKNISNVACENITSHSNSAVKILCVEKISLSLVELR